MNSLTNELIQRWRRQRSRTMLKPVHTGSYAFVGVGNHALQNLYPALQYLGIRLKYICCNSHGKLPLIEARFGTTATTSLETIADDQEIKGVFVCTSPRSHFSICSRLIEAGKFVFVEKPPCLTSGELKSLIEADVYKKTMVGMQKRYSPLIQTLRERLSGNAPLSYTMTYRTGPFPEGDPLTELFIHPLDLAIHLFGAAEIKDIQQMGRNGEITLQILLTHNHVIGCMELSTAYSWSRPEETLHVNTASGEYRLESNENLTFRPHPKKLFGIPLDKAGVHNMTEQILSERNSFIPSVTNNQLHTQGFISEIRAFADMTEKSGKNFSPLSALTDTYRLLDIIRTKHNNHDE
ncbi:MAG: Gfo/Idh/MocA family oxidoreductase [Muribaculaceae bacterium]|nr:Gfo/Idh/MocA family oxidoreductase [Muribaculaceae bacterium]